MTWIGAGWGRGEGCQVGEGKCYGAEGESSGNRLPGTGCWGLAASRRALLSARLQLPACGAEELKEGGLVRGRPFGKKALS